MGSLFNDWPSFNPHNFSQLRSSDPPNPPKMTPTPYCATHNRTLPPADQVIYTDPQNILLRSFYQRTEKKFRKRAASEHLMPDHGGKKPKTSTSC